MEIYYTMNQRIIADARSVMDNAEKLPHDPEHRMFTDDELNLAYEVVVKGFICPVQISARGRELVVQPENLPLLQLAFFLMASAIQLKSTPVAVVGLTEDHKLLEFERTDALITIVWEHGKQNPLSVTLPELEAAAGRLLREARAIVLEALPEMHENSCLGPWLRGDELIPDLWRHPGP